MAVKKDNVLASGFSFTEGPCIDRNGTLHVVELANRCVSKMVDGRREVLAVLGGAPNGAAFGPTGDLFVVNNGGNWAANASTDGPGRGGHIQGCVQRVSADGSFEVVLDEIDGVPLNSPNDIVFDGEGNFYFTDPVWPAMFDDGTPDMSTISKGSICFGRPDGSGRRLNSDLLFPNGIQISDDGRSLIVDETWTGKVYRFPIIAPGEVGEPEVYVDLGDDTGPDGMCFDREGHLLVAGHGASRVFVVAPGGGTVERELEFEDAEITNVCFGGSDFKTLFVTQASLGRIVAVEWETEGMRLLGER